MASMAQKISISTVGMIPINRSMAYTEELEPEIAELYQEMGVECLGFVRYIRFPEDIKTEDAEWRKILEESKSEIEKNPHLKNFYDEFIREHDSLISAVTYRLAKLFSNDHVNSSELLKLFRGICAYDDDIRAEIRNDLSAARVRYVPNQSYVETLLYSRSFLALQAHKVAHKLWSRSEKNLALFIQKRVSEVFAVNILPEEKIKSLMLLNKATGRFDGETGTGKNVTIYHGKVSVCQNKTLAKESPNHPANLVRKRLKDGYFHQEFYRDEEATAFGCQPHGAEIYQDGSIQLVQADNGSANSTQLASPPLNYKASAPPGNIRDGNGQPLHYINDGASSSQARPSDRRYQLNLSSSPNEFLPTGGELIQPADRGSTNSTPLASPSWNNTATAPPGNISGNGKPLCYINEGESSSQGGRASGRNQINLSSSANIFPHTGGQLIQSDGRDSTDSTQVASSPLSIAVCAANNTGRASVSSGNIEDGTRQAQHHTNCGAASSLVRPTNGRNKNKHPLNYKASAPPGNIRDGNGQPLHYINNGASSSQARPSDGRYQLNNEFLPTGGEPIQPADRGGAEIYQDGSIQLVQADNGSANSTQLASPPLNYKASAPPGNIRDGNGQPLHYINDGASSSQARPSDGRYQLNNEFLPTGGEPIQPADRGSTNSTPLAWPSRIAVCAANNTGRASASSGNIEDGTRQAQHHTNGGAASSLVRPTNGRNKDKLSSLATIFIPIAFALLVASSAIWYSAGSTSLSARARILLILAEVFGFNGLLLCLGGYSRPSGSPSAQWLTVVGCVTILCGYISIMCTQLL